MCILVTGAKGFIGTSLMPTIAQKGWPYRILERSAFNDFSKPNSCSKSLTDIDTVIHLAARAHLVKNNSACSLAQYRAINTEMTLNFAYQASCNGVRRFIFISTVKVNGEESLIPYTEKSAPNPQDPYAQSKWEAEQGLRAISKETGMEVVIIRPSLVYGSSVKANFLKLLQWLDKDLPLPLASISNRRSLIFVGNLVDFIKCCIEHPKAANQTFLVSDGEDLSTPELIQRLAKQFNREPKLFPFPPTALQSALKLIGKHAEAQKLLGSLRLDPTFAYRTLDWTPPYTVDAGLAETVQAYKNSKWSS